MILRKKKMIDRKVESTNNRNNELRIEGFITQPLLQLGFQAERFMRGPCECCGDSKHGLLRYVATGGACFIKANCQYAKDLIIDIPPNGRGATRIKYVVKVMDFVKNNKGNREGLMRDIYNLEFHGTGRFMPQAALEDFKMKVYRTSLMEEGKQVADEWYTRSPHQGGGVQSEGL